MSQKEWASFALVVFVAMLLGGVLVFYLTPMLPATL